MTSKILRLFLLAGMLSFSVLMADSCAPTAPKETGTTSLVSTPSSLTLTRTDSSQSSVTGLTCGCSYLLSVTGYGGDTNVIHFSFAERRDTLITLHTVIVTIHPSTLVGSGKDSAWIALYTPNDSINPATRGTPLYDTLRVNATY